MCSISTSQNQMVRDRAASAPVLADIDLQKVSEGQRRAVLGQEKMCLAPAQYIPQNLIKRLPQVPPCRSCEADERPDHWTVDRHGETCILVRLSDESQI
jgi:hypothetical protein